MQSTAPSPASAGGYPSAKGRSQQLTHPEGEQQEDFAELLSDISSACGKYCARQPRVAAGCLFALGFFVGWKLRPW